jgi:DNA-binding NarL/FixJ family response regulator
MAAREEGSVTRSIGGDAVEGGGLDLIAGNEPSPELAAQVVDEYRRLRSGLRTDTLRQVLDLGREGYTRREIARRLGCAERAVKRKLDVIREAWMQGEL